MSLRAATAVAVLGALAATAPAQAATLVGDRACYREGELVRVTGTGYTPNGVVNFSRDNLSFGTVPADAAGNVAAKGPAPQIGSTKQRNFVLEARDATNPGIFATVNPLVTRLEVTVNPRGGNPARKRRIRARGFTRGRTLYVHVGRFSGGKRKNIRLGRLKKPCGTKSVKKRIFRRTAKPGTYRVQFDTRRRYSSRTLPKVTYRVEIFRTFRRSLSSSSAVGERWVQE